MRGNLHDVSSFFRRGGHAEDCLSAYAVLSNRSMPRSHNPGQDDSSSEYCLISQFVFVPPLLHDLELEDFKVLGGRLRCGGTWRLWIRLSQSYFSTNLDEVYAPLELPGLQLLQPPESTQTDSE